MEFTTPEQAKNAIKKWLTENGHHVNDIAGDENANFHLEIDYPLASQKRQRVIQPKEYPGLIVVLNGVAVAPEHAEKLKAWTHELEEVVEGGALDEAIGRRGRPAPACRLAGAAACPGAGEG